MIFTYKNVKREVSKCCYHTGESHILRYIEIFFKNLAATSKFIILTVGEGLSFVSAVTASLNGVVFGVHE